LTADPGRLPSSLASLHAWVACVADARPLEEIAALAEAAGLAVELTERHDGALAALLDRVEARLELAAMVAVDVAAARGLLGEVRGALESGALGYGVVVARRP